MIASFFVPGIPVGQPRPRAFARSIGGRMTAGVYDPKTSKGWKEAIIVYAKNNIGLGLHLTSAVVELRFYFPRPKHHFLKKGLRDNAPIVHVLRPDLDNLAKCVLDALTDSCRLWSDDGCVYSLTMEKGYSSPPDYATGVWIQVSRP